MTDDMSSGLLSIVEKPGLNFSQAVHTAAILKGDCAPNGGKLHASPEPGRQMRNCLMAASHKIGRWVRNGLITALHSIVYLAMFETGLQGKPPRLESYCDVALSMWRQSRSPGHHGRTIPLQPQLEWKFHECKSVSRLFTISPVPRIVPDRVDAWQIFDLWVHHKTGE